jgi:hypothetical protein
VGAHRVYANLFCEIDRADATHPTLFVHASKAELSSIRYRAALVGAHRVHPNLFCEFDRADATHPTPFAPRLDQPNSTNSFFGLSVGLARR